MIPASEFWGANHCENPPLTDSDLSVAEARLGVRLPQEFVQLLRIQNGGYTSGLAFPMRVATTWAEDHVPLDDLAGIVVDDTHEGVHNILHTDNMTKEWGLPPRQVLLAGDGHWWITLDYRNSDDPVVTWLDVDAEQDLVVAPSFRAFLDGLVPAAQFADLNEQDSEDVSLRWRPERIHAAIGELQTSAGPVPCLRLTQDLVEGETGWSMRVFILPPSWVVDSLEFRASDLCMTLVDGRTFRVNGRNSGALATAVIDCRRNGSAALEAAWQTHALCEPDNGP